jgi:hypothetical protein
MGIASAGSAYGFNYVAADQQTGLNVAASVYDTTTGTPVFLSQIPLTEVNPTKSPGSYSGLFTPTAGKVYDIISMVYTDPGYTTLDPNRAPGCETIQAVSISGGGGGGSTVGIKVLKGYVIDPNSYSGKVLGANMNDCPGFFTLFIGDDLDDQLLGVELNGDPVNLTGVTDIQISFPNNPSGQPPPAQPTYTASLLGGQIAVVDAVLGKLSLTIPNAVTQFFLAIQGYDIDIVLIFSGINTTYRIPAGCNVVNRSAVSYT